MKRKIEISDLDFDRVLSLIKIAHSTGEKWLSLKIEWAATIGPLLRTSIEVMEEMKDGDK